MVFMKRWVLILPLILSYSYQPRISNDLETLDKVFAKPEFDIEIQHRGCFGGSEDHFNITLTDNGYLLKYKKTGKSHLVSKKNIDSLKAYLKGRIGRTDNGFCTTSEYIRVGTFRNSVDYKHSHCPDRANDILNNILDYHALILESRLQELDEPKP